MQGSRVCSISPLITLKPVADAEGLKPVIHNVNIALELEQIFYELQFPKS